MTTDGQPEQAPPSGPRPPRARGRFVVLEGLDGVGTTTVATLVAGALEERGFRVLLTAEPTDGPYGRLLRQHIQHEVALDPQAAGLAFTADRADHLATGIVPALQRGRWVVCDRYLLSTLAYQGAGGVDRASILAASDGFAVPDLTCVLGAGDDVRQGRMSSRGRVDRYEDPALAASLRASYAASIELLRAHGHRIVEVDASAPAADVAADVLERLARLDAAD